MKWLAKSLRWIRSVSRRNEIERGLDEEIRFHIDQQIEKNMRAGMAWEEARRQAMLAFGGADAMKERTRDEFRLAVVEDSLRDLRYALRSLRRAPAFTATAALTLALGLGATTAIFSVVHGVLIKPLPYPGADNLVAVSHSAPGMNITSMPTAVTQFLTYRDHSRTLAAIGLWSTGEATVTGLAEPEQIDVVNTTHGTLQALGVAPAIGRWFSPQDDFAESERTVILAHGYWQRRYGADRGVLGRTLILDSLPRTIVGVMPDGFRFLDEQPQAFVPFRLERSRLVLGAFNFSSLARMRPGVTFGDAQADLSRLVPVWFDAWPSPPGFPEARFRSAGIAPVIRPLHEAVVGDVGSVLWILLGTIGVVLVIACANVANLLLVRAEARQQELAVRSALGAARGRLARELFIESLALAVIGGVAGLALGYAGVELLVRLGPTTLPRLHEIAIDVPVVMVALAVSCASGGLFGAIPVLRHATPNCAQSLRGSSRSLTDSPDRHRVRSILVIVQVALAVVLMVGSGLMVRTLFKLRSVNPGFSHSDDVQLVRISIPESLVSDPERVLRAQMDVRERLAAIPAVSAVSFASGAPMEPYVSADGVFADGPEGDPARSKVRRFKFVSPGFFTSVGIPIVAGRDFSWTDVQRRAPVTVVSENLAREVWGAPAEAIGKRIRENTTSPWREIVGVVANVHDNGSHAPAPATVYWPPLLERFWGDAIVVRRSMTYVMRTPRAATQALLDDVRRAVWAVNANVPVTEIQTLGAVYRRSMARTSFTLVMLAIAGTMALLLGVVGIYGVVAYSVSQRHREIGIRTALGAARSQLEKMFVRQGVRLAIAGVFCGSIAAALAVRVMASLLFGTDPVDPLTYLCVGFALISAAALASYLPAHRAATVDPMSALRSE